MKNKLFKPVMAVALASIVALGSIVSFSATVNETQTVSESGNKEAEVVYTQDSNFIVTIPKKITLDSDKTSVYEVNVIGDIASDEIITVVPDASFLMKDQATVGTLKADVTATVSQDKTEWTSPEIAVEGGSTTDGSVSALDLTAGNWKGTFNFNINLIKQGFNITAVDELGTNLNATGSYIIGNQKNILINELVESGLIQNKNEVSTLIDVQSDEFTGNAITTFNVSNIAKEGDIVTFYHYDETDEWEYIGTAVVSENGTATGSFNSFSPVAISVEKLENHTHSYDAGVVTKEATCTEDGEKTFTCYCGDSYTEAISAIGHNPVNGYCTICNEKIAGLYDTDGNLLCTWEESGINVEADYTLDTTLAYTLNEYPSATKLIIPEGVTSIGDYAFYNSSRLTSIEIPDSVTSIGKDAFWRCTNLANVKLGNGLINIEDYAFDSCTSLTSIKIPDSVTNIGISAFGNCTSLTSIEIPDSVISMGNSAFSDCTSLVNVVIGNNVISIGDYAFYCCTNLTSVIVGNNVTSIGDKAFYNCVNLTSINIPDSIISIGIEAFYSCTSLTSNIKIPDGVTNIGDKVFYNCSNLTNVTIPDSVTSIGESAFQSCTSLTNITIPDSVTSIGDYAFYFCEGLTNVTIGNGVSDIGNYAFYNCESLTNIDIPDSVTSIGSYAFNDCTSLTNIDIPDGVTSIGKYAFQNCNNVTSVTIPSSVTSIGQYAFQNCTGEAIINCRIPSATSSSYGAFYKSKFTKVTIREGVTSIGNYAFYGSWCLTNIEIPDSVTNIGKQAFYNCTSLTSATFKTTEDWYVGSSAGAKTTALSSTNLANTSTAATYLKTTYYNKYWTR